MRTTILMAIFIVLSACTYAQTLIVNPQNNVNEGGEIALLPSNSSFNDWRIDNYAGFLRFHHSGKSYFDLTKNGNLYLRGTAIFRASSNIEGGEIQLLGGSSHNQWNIDNYRGYLRFHHSGRSYFNLNRNGNLSVQGKIEAKEVKVTNSPTADFVFEDDYNLPSLNFVENHIKTKKHLPEIASAQKMKEEGVNIGDFQIQLLQKIEELTLYTIQQQKELQSLYQRIDTLEKQIEK